MALRPTHNETKTISPRPPHSGTKTMAPPPPEMKANQELGPELEWEKKQQNSILRYFGNETNKYRQKVGAGRETKNQRWIWRISHTKPNQTNKTKNFDQFSHF